MSYCPNCGSTQRKHNEIDCGRFSASEDIPLWPAEDADES